MDNKSDFIVRCNLSSNLFDPEIRLDGKWEVAFYDLSPGDFTSSSTSTIASGEMEQIRVRKRDFLILGHPPKEASQYNLFSMLFKAHSTEWDRLKRPGDEKGTVAIRQAFQRFGGKWGGGSPQASQFDIWNYQIPITTL